MIEKKIEENTYENSIEAIIKARNLILLKYNFFALISYIIDQDRTTATPPKDHVILHPQIYFEEKQLSGKIKGILRSARKNIYRLIKYPS
jgi:hypothetical protein